MTVHGAKGLEAPVVILADAANKPQGNQVNRPVYLMTDAPGPLLVHASGSKSHVTAEPGRQDAGRRQSRRRNIGASSMSA